MALATALSCITSCNQAARCLNCCNRFVLRLAALLFCHVKVISLPQAPCCEHMMSGRVFRTVVTVWWAARGAMSCVLRSAQFEDCCACTYQKQALVYLSIIKLKKACMAVNPTFEPTFHRPVPPDTCVRVQVMARRRCPVLDHRPGRLICRAALLLPVRGRQHQLFRHCRRAASTRVSLLSLRSLPYA